MTSSSLDFDMCNSACTMIDADLEHQPQAKYSACELQYSGMFKVPSDVCVSCAHDACSGKLLGTYPESSVPMAVH
jgi:hypothetical protein